MKARALPIVVALATVPVAAHAQAPCQMPIQSYLTAVDGTPRDTPIDIEVTFFDGPDGGAAAIDCRTFSDVPVEDGWVNLSLESCSLPELDPSGCGIMTIAEILDAGRAIGSEVWVAFRLEDDVFDAGPRTRLGAVPYAVHAANATLATTATNALSADVAATVEGFDPDDYTPTESLSTIATTGSYTDLADRPPALDTLGALICEGGQVPVWSEAISGWVCGAGGGGSVDFDGDELVVGTRGEGDAYESLDTPLTIPDGIITGITSARFVPDATTIRTLSLDLTIDHPLPNQLTVVLSSPEGTALTVIDGPTTTLTEIDGNFGWDIPMDGGDLYSFYEEDAGGVWTMRVVDETPGGSGSLISWRLRINEEFSGRAFIGSVIETPGQVLANEIIVTNGGRMVFRDVTGTDVFELTAGEPSDTERIRVSTGLLVDAEARGSQTWWNAASTCISEGGQLCTPAQLSGMCSAGIISLSAGAHWTDDMGGRRDGGRTIGTGCTSNSHTPTSNGRVFRCCYTF